MSRRQNIKLMFDIMTRPRLDPQHTKSAALSERRPLSATAAAKRRLFPASSSVNKLGFSSYLAGASGLGLRTARRWAGCRTWWGRTAAL